MSGRSIKKRIAPLKSWPPARRWINHKATHVAMSIENLASKNRTGFVVLDVRPGNETQLLVACLTPRSSGLRGNIQLYSTLNCSPFVGTVLDKIELATRKALRVDDATLSAWATLTFKQLSPSIPITVGDILVSELSAARFCEACKILLVLDRATNSPVRRVRERIAIDCDKQIGIKTQYWSEAYERAFDTGSMLLFNRLSITNQPSFGYIKLGRRTGDHEFEATLLAVGGEPAQGDCLLFDWQQHCVEFGAAGDLVLSGQRIERATSIICNVL